MNLFKAIRYDLWFGIYESAGKYIGTALFALLLFLCFGFEMVHLSMKLTGSTGNVGNLSASLGDAILISSGGSLTREHSKYFLFPTFWLLSLILPCFLTLNGTMRDLGGGGMQIITRLGSKTKWWLSKCVLNAATVLLYYAILYLVLAILCLARGFELSLIPDEQLFLSYFSAIFVPEEVTEGQMFLALCLMPCLVTAALSLVQTTLTLFVRPTLAYLLICGYIIGSVLSNTPFFIANFAMPVRSAAVGIYNYDFITCLVCVAAVSAAAVLIGRARIIRMDILQGGWT